MLKNYLKVALRNLIKFKTYSAINIAGLAIGMAIFLLAIIYVRFEMGFDEFHKNKDRIYRVIKKAKFEQGYENRMDCGAPLSPLLLQNYTEIEKSTRLFPLRGEVNYEDKSFEEPNLCFADSDFLKIFSFDLVRGDFNSALNGPSAVLITERMATKYFGLEDPINKSITLKLSSRPIQLKITGVLKDIPQNSHIQIDFLASFESLNSVLPKSFFTSRWSSPVVTYVMLRDRVSPGSLESQFPDFVNKYVDKESYLSLDLNLQPLGDIYFNSISMGGGNFEQGSKEIVMIFLLLSAFILIIACLNYMNISTARSMYRFKEVGIRKVLGSVKKQLKIQFIGESLIFSFIAILISTLIVEAFLPTFRNITGLNLRINYLHDYFYILTIFGIAICVGVLSGIYPAFFMSSSSPGISLKGDTKLSHRSILRKVFVVFQFSISIILILGSITIYNQVELLKNKDMGFEKENIVLLPIKDLEILNKYPTFKSELLKLNGVKNITASSQIPGLDSPNGISISSKTDEKIDMPIIYVDFDYINSLQIKLAEGRDFKKEISTDENNAVLVNERFVNKMGWNYAIGKNLELFFIEKDKKIPMYSADIVGVVKDFNFRDLLNSIQPVIFKIDNRRFQNIIIKLEKNNQLATIDNIKKTFKDFFPSKQVDITFLDQNIEQAYKEFETFRNIIFYATILAVFIACLGLLGLTSFSIERRTKEIGIRKVLGSSVNGIIFVLSKEFLILIGIAILIAWVSGYYLMDKILDNFAYRVNVSIWTLILSGLFVLIAASIALGYQSVKAALSNPIESLRYE